MPEGARVANFIPPELFSRFQHLANEITTTLRREGVLREDEEISPRAVAYDILRETFQPIKCSHLKLKEYNKSLKYCCGCYSLFKHGATAPLRLIDKTEEIRIKERFRRFINQTVRQSEVNREVTLTKAEEEEMERRNRELEAIEDEERVKAANRKRHEELDKEWLTSQQKEKPSYVQQK